MNICEKDQNGNFKEKCAIKLESNANSATKKRNSIFTSELITLICVLNASLGLFVNGTFVGWSSYAVDFLPEMFTAQQNLRIFSALAFGAAVSPLIIHKIWHFVGTKRTILLANTLMVISWILTTFHENYWCLLLGRGVGGLAVGALHLLIPIYVNDISTIEQKPTHNCIMQMQFVFGILTQYILRFFQNYLVINIIPAVICLSMLLTVCYMPESPRYLALRGQQDVAKGVLLKFKSIDKDTENELKIWHEVDTKKGILYVFKEDFGIKYAIPLFGLFAFEQLIGAISILFFLQKILVLIEVEYSPEVTAVLCCCVFVCSVILPNIVDYSVPIKGYLIWSTNLMAMCLIALGVYCHYQGTFGHEYTEEYRHLPLICLGLFFFFFATGPYRLTQEYAEQIIPKKNYFSVRCLLTAISWAFIYAITRILPGLIGFIGVGWLFWYMAFMCLFMSIFVRLYLPDLKKHSDECKLIDSSSSSSGSCSEA